MGSRHSYAGRYLLLLLFFLTFPLLIFILQFPFPFIPLIRLVSFSVACFRRILKPKEKLWRNENMLYLSKILKPVSILVFCMTNWPTLILWNLVLMELFVRFVFPTPPPFSFLMISFPVVLFLLSLFGGLTFYLAWVLCFCYFNTPILTKINK